VTCERPKQAPLTNTAYQDADDMAEKNAIISNQTTSSERGIREKAIRRYSILLRWSLTLMMELANGDSTPKLKTDAIDCTAKYGKTSKSSCPKKLTKKQQMVKRNKVVVRTVQSK